MKYNYKHILSIAISFIIIGVSNIFAQGARDLSSFEGRNFRVVFMQNEVSHSLLPDPINTLDLFISSIFDANVKIVGPGKNEIIKVEQNTMQKVSFDRAAVLNESEIINSRSIHITSDVPITIYGLNSINTSSDIFSAVPVKNWGNEYVVMSYPNDIYRDYSDIPVEQATKPRKSQFAVVSAYDNTNVKIKPTVMTNGGHPAGVEFVVTLNAGETYLVQSSDVAEGGDLTGTLIQSDKPVGAFSGHVRTGIYQTLPYPWASKDHLCEMLMPTSSWGKNYITMPFEFSKQTNATLYRITTISNNTTINVSTASGRELTFLIENSTDCLTIDSLNEPAIWKSTSPIQIMQYVRHDGSGNDNKLYDPSMSGVPPVEQYVPKILFQVPANAAHIPKQYVGHTSMLIVEKTAVNNIRIDGKLLIENSDIEDQQIGTSDYYWVRVPLSSGNHTFYADSGRFSGVLYGYGEADSYSVVMGSSLLPMTMTDTVPPVAKIDTVCNHLSGYFYEPTDEIAHSGLDFAYVDKILTMNYDYSLGTQSDSSTYYTFSADVIDDSKEAYIQFICRDRAGNLTVIDHRFYPMNMSYSHQTLNIEAVDWKGSAGRNLWVENKSKKAYRLLAISSDNPKVKVNADNLPILLEGNGGKYDFDVEITPNSDFADIKANLTFEFECNKTHIINVIAKVTATELASRGYDFGEVIVGQNACADIMITNTGKADVMMNSITVEPENTQLVYDTVGIFPRNLKTGDSLKIPVCFAPIEKGTQNQTVTFNYGSDGTRAVNVTGKGIQSELANLKYDFGACRLGTTNAHTFTLTNTGNVTANVKYFRTETSSDEFEISEFKALKNDVVGGGDLSFSVAYKPKNEGKYTLKAYYILDDDSTKKYSMTLDGEGIIPKIEVNDHNVGEIKIFSTKDTTLRIVNSTGSEKLSIESVRIAGGDQSSFEIDLSNAQNKILQNGEFIEVPVHFAPQFVGVHRVELAVKSDAAENYQKVENVFMITGISRAIDTTNYTVKMYAPEEVTACNSYEIKIQIKNTGNVNSLINNLTTDIEGNLTTGDWAEKYEFPMQIAPSEIREFVYKFLPVAGSEGTFKFRVEMNNNAPEDLAYQFKAITNTLTLIPINEINFNPGDTVTVKFAGAFPNGTDKNTNANLRIYTDRFALRLIKKEYKLEIDENNKKYEIPLVLEQNIPYIDVPLFYNSNVKTDGMSWKIDLDFQTYLADERDNPIYFEVVSDECFISEDDSVNAKLIGVCVYDTRPIELINPPNVRINYEKNSDAVNINIENFSDNEKYFFTLIKSSGETVKMVEKSIGKGENLIQIDMSDCAQGAYILNVDGAIYKNNILFIKLK